MIRLRGAIAVPVAALLALAPAFGAHADDAARASGSVPSEVATFVADGSLVRQLDDVYGLGADGEGIDFDPETTKPGTIVRVHVWSAALLAGEDTDHPVDLINEWIVPIAIDEEPVGVATVWIDPQTVRPGLAVFAAGAGLATALSDIPADASLVRDDASAAWLALGADGVVTPLVPGMTGLSTPVPLDDIAILPPATGTATPGGDPGTGVGLAVAVVLVLLAIIVVALVLPRRRRRADAPDEVAEEPAAEEPDPEEPAIEEPATEEPATEEPDTEEPAGEDDGAPGEETVAGDGDEDSVAGDEDEPAIDPELEDLEMTIETATTSDPEDDEEDAEGEAASTDIADDDPDAEPDVESDEQPAPEPEGEPVPEPEPEQESEPEPEPESEPEPEAEPEQAADAVAPTASTTPAKKKRKKKRKKKPAPAPVDEEPADEPTG